MTLAKTQHGRCSVATNAEDQTNSGCWNLNTSVAITWQQQWSKAWAIRARSRSFCLYQSISLSINLSVNLLFSPSPSPPSPPSLSSSIPLPLLSLSLSLSLSQLKCPHSKQGKTHYSIPLVTHLGPRLKVFLPAFLPALMRSKRPTTASSLHLSKLSNPGIVGDWNYCTRQGLRASSCLPLAWTRKGWYCMAPVCDQLLRANVTTRHHPNKPFKNAVWFTFLCALRSTRFMTV